ncbi:hypothetical protein CKAN_02215000 [Cinnamomum micranthum f. kanehirae]|uniref:Uncharacterized protein n=1 Tax=Cinnamomum micranthum f. kanehirae TaxID=337451 RepID=A0A443PQ65_9MAGN|nr:hypothetical protein CKAN_02215000 [Cinnamomum micranthum f. kanehirae]
MAEVTCIAESVALELESSEDCVSQQNPIPSDDRSGMDEKKEILSYQSFVEKGKNLADDTSGACAEAVESEIVECSSARSSSEGKNLADDTCGACAEAEESEILECSSARSSSEGKNLADDTCGAYAEEVRNEALEGCDCQQNTISSSTREDDGVEAHHYSSSTENDGVEAHVPFTYSEEDHIHFPSEDDHIHSSEDDHSSEGDHFSHEDGEEGHVSSSTPVEDVWLSDLIDADLEDASTKFPPLVEMALNFIFPGSSTLSGGGTN